MTEEWCGSKRSKLFVTDLQWKNKQEKEKNIGERMD